MNIIDIINIINSISIINIIHCEQKLKINFNTTFSVIIFPHQTIFLRCLTAFLKTPICLSSEFCELLISKRMAVKYIERHFLHLFACMALSLLLFPF